MPLQREHWQFAFIFLIVPIQYYIVQHSGSSESSRTHQISVLIKQVQEFYDRWFRVESWVKWLRTLLESKLYTIEYYIQIMFGIKHVKSLEEKCVVFSSKKAGNH